MLAEEMAGLYIFQLELIAASNESYRPEVCAAARKELESRPLEKMLAQEIAGLYVGQLESIASNESYRPEVRTAARKELESRHSGPFGDYRAQLEKLEEESYRRLASMLNVP